MTGPDSTDGPTDGPTDGAGDGRADGRTDRPGPFDRWYRTAGVRSGTRRIFQAETGQGKVFFPERLVPHLAHPAVRRLPQARREELVLRHLYQFLHATTHVETRVVNSAAERIANGRSGLDLPAATRLDAFKVYCDEGYHALYSLDLAEQIAASTGVPVPHQDYGGFVTRLDATGARLLPGEPVLAELLRTVVFETLITAVLNELPTDPRVVTTVRELMGDHARDEGRHHRFFSQFFAELWTQLGAAQRQSVTRVMPALIRDCLEADLPLVRSSLARAGLDRDTVHAVVQDCYRSGTSAPRLERITRATVQLCRSVGVLDQPGAEERFAAHGLLRTGD